MEKFMLIVRENLGKIGKLTTEQRLAGSPDMSSWVESLVKSGNYIEGQPLAVTGKYVSQNSVMSDGPFIESKEGISGYDIVLAKDIDEAVKIAQSCPMVQIGMAIREVRPLLDMDFPEPGKGK